MSYVIQQGWAMYWGTARWSQVEIMEAYTNCRQFNCITPIVEQSEYHMFCREKCELYLPEMYNKIGVGLMAWGPLSMALSDTQNGDKLFLPKGSFKTKSFSWTEDEINRNVRMRMTQLSLPQPDFLIPFPPFIRFYLLCRLHCRRRVAGARTALRRADDTVIACATWRRWPRSSAAARRSYRSLGH